MLWKPKLTILLIWLYLLVLIVLSIVGALNVAFYRDPTLLYTYVPLVAISPLMYLFLEPQKSKTGLKLIIIYIISISLCYHITLSSQYLNGADIQVEHYLAQRILESGFWDPTIPHTYNSAFSVTILTPILQIVSSLSLIEIFKIAFPLICSIIPLILYKMYIKLGYNEKESFIATFYFISMFPFYTELLQIVKQMIAEVILALLLYYIIAHSNESNFLKRFRDSSLLVLFMSALVYSHYGTYYTWLSIFLISELIIFVLLRRKALLYVIITSFIIHYMHYTYTSGASIIIAAATTVRTFIENINEMLSPYYAQGVEYVVKPKTFLHQFLTYMYLFTLIFIALGVLSNIMLMLQLFIRKQAIYQEKKILYHSLTIAAGIFFIITGFSTMSAAVNITRIYHLASFILAPSLVDGYKFVGRVIRFVKRESFWISFLALFLLFNSGYMYEVANKLGYPEESFSDALNPFIDRFTPTSQDYYAILWLKYFSQDNLQVYADIIGKNNIRAYINLSRIILISPQVNLICGNVVFIRENNAFYGFLVRRNIGTMQIRQYIKMDVIYNTTEHSLVYSGGSMIGLAC